MVIKLYISQTSGNVEVKGQQDYIKRIFDSKSIPYEEVDIAAPYYEKEKKYMQEEVRKTQSPAATTDDQTPQQPEPILPPQLFVDNAYRGDFSRFFEAVETETMYKYLGLVAPPDEVEYQRQQQQQQQQQQNETQIE